MSVLEHEIEMRKREEETTNSSLSLKGLLAASNSLTSFSNSFFLALEATQVSLAILYLAIGTKIDKTAISSSILRLCSNCLIGFSFSACFCSLRLS